MAELLRITPQDSVAVALTALSSGQTVTVDGISLTTVTDVPAGHKVALFPIKAGEKVIKYGFPIGYAKEDIPVGAHVHVHNLPTGLSGELTYEYHPTYPTIPEIPAATFMGYPRKDGRVGVRNELWILPTVGTSMTFRANYNFDLRFQTTYYLQPPMVRESRQHLNTLTLGLSANIAF